MHSKKLHEIYRDKYLNLKKQTGGSLQSDITRNIKNMSIDDLLKIGPIKRYIIDEILSYKRLPNEEFGNIEFQNSLGEGHFGKTFKINYKGEEAIAKIMPSTNESKKFFEAEIVSHTLINKSGCNLPKIYGFFEDIIYDGKNVDVIIAEFIKGNNMLKELSNNNLNIMNSEHFYFINIWINKLESTVKCLHQSGIVHRDIKVDNVMIKYDKNNNATKNAILIDYGLSCRYIAFCLSEMYVPITSPIKIINRKNKVENIEIEKMNDCYSLGILILDVLSLVINKELFHGKIPAEINIRKLEFGKLMEYINRFVNDILNKYPIARILTDKAYKYIRLGLTEKEETVLDNGVFDKEVVLANYSQPLQNSSLDLGYGNEYSEYSGYNGYDGNYDVASII